MAKLRTEFDTGKSSMHLRLDLRLTTLNTGADFGIVESDPGDLDPHAVASVFKAYLRECERLVSFLVLPVTDIPIRGQTN